MKKGRIEAFSDGVLAIIITIMVLEIKVPHGSGLADLKPVIPVFLSYVLSFIYIGIYWNNHHHMMATVKKVTGDVLWANLHLLFWLSLVPFTTGWMGENHFTAASLFMYGIVLLGAAIAYFILQTAIVKKHGKQSVLAIALGRDLKGKLSPVFYIIGISTSFFNIWISGITYILVAIMWLVPDKRIEKTMQNDEPK